SRKVEGFYLGCRWIASPKDIPVPEKVLKRIERLRGGPMIESERDIQILISEWQRMEFRKMKEQILTSGGATSSTGLSSSHPCPDCCCKGCVNPDQGESTPVGVCVDCVTGRVVAYAPPGGCGNLLCFCSFSIMGIKATTFAPIGWGDPNSPNCEECRSGATSQPNCEIVCEGEDWDPQALDDEPVVSGVSCPSCGWWNPACWENWRAADCDACRRKTDEIRNYFIHFGRFHCGPITTVIGECCPDENQFKIDRGWRNEKLGEVGSDDGMCVACARHERILKYLPSATPTEPGGGMENYLSRGDSGAGFRRRFTPIRPSSCLGKPPPSSSDLYSVALA
ncbi:MAG: hypothetical protein V2G43_03760, partial [bacterium JZ-2024 1]